jgi:NADPH-dependent 2,4-dienoyl-CoA reductase/sulfur reductase-like enzyme
MLKSNNSRRDVLKLASAATFAALAPSGKSFAQAAGNVVVIGGGYGGATAAKYLRRVGVNVTLIDASPIFVTCPFSNTVLGVFGEMAQVTHSWDGLRRAGVTVVVGTVSGIDAAQRRVTVQGNNTPIAYDRLIVSPGIDFKFTGAGSIMGYNEAATERMPHAWNAGPQTELLRRQLVAMEDGGVVVMAIPNNPFRCPPGPYERASLIAHYLKSAKPRSKLILLDAKDTFSKMALFQAAWQAVYPGMIEWVSFSQGGNVNRVDTATMTVYTDFGMHKGNVVNVIPPQRAGAIAISAGLAGTGDFCMVNPQTFESRVTPNIHVIGDACVAGAMPKSGFSASNQGKVTAAAVAALLRGQQPTAPSMINVCYSLINPDYGISVSSVHRIGDDGTIIAVPNSGGNSPAMASADFRKKEADYARSWYAAMANELWG